MRYVIACLLALLATVEAAACCVNPCSSQSFDSSVESRFDEAKYVLLLKIDAITRTPSKNPAFESTITAKAHILEVFKGRLAPLGFLHMELGQPDVAFAWEGDLLVVFLNKLHLTNDDFAEHSCETRAIIVSENDPHMAILRRLAGSRSES